MFHFACQKAGMKDHNEEALQAMMREMKVSNKNYYVLREKKVKDNEDRINSYKEKIKTRKSNEHLWGKTKYETKRRYDVYRTE